MHFETLALSISFILLALTKHTFGNTFTFSQEIALILLSFCYVYSIAKYGIIDRVGLIFAAISSAVFLSIFVLEDFNNVPNLVNTILIFFSFPFVIQIARLFYGKKAWRFGNIALFVVLALTALGGLAIGWDVSYLGDPRGARLVAGWKKPSFLAEAASLLIFIMVARRHVQGGALIGVKGLVPFWILIFGLFLVIVLTGSRATLGASVIFLYWMWQETRKEKPKLVLKFLLSFGVLAAVLWFSSYEVDIKALNETSSGRWRMLVIETKTHLSSLDYWLFGNADAYMVFLTNNFGNIVYHIDSFIGERLIVTGFLGLLLLALCIWHFYLRMGTVGRSVIMACLFYGIFEHGVFNVTSLFSIFSMLISAISARQLGALRPSLEKALDQPRSAIYSRRWRHGRSLRQDHR
jgi:hypothetical protein